MKIEFAFRKEKSKIFGDILRPVAEIIFINKDKEILEYPYVDSGADVTLIPKSVGELLGFELGKGDEIKNIRGIGDIEIPIIIKKIKLKIGDKMLDTRIAWSLVEDVPILLGRADIFKFFNVTFEKEEKTVFSE